MDASHSEITLPETSVELQKRTLSHFNIWNEHPELLVRFVCGD